MSSVNIYLDEYFGGYVLGRPNWVDFLLGALECLCTALFLFFGFFGCRTLPLIADSPLSEEGACAVSFGTSLLVVSSFSACFKCVTLCNLLLCHGFH